ncbi:hypothetical protein DL769_010186 [Monosporascus sp. CRB-8-3]|nr:hypothetical protein DL769_010186 [Monosporascus sp. CRB-8-3]
MHGQNIPKRGLYKALDVGSDAPFEEIKASYRRLALENHPDKAGNTPENNATFARIQEAYEVLSDPAKRQAQMNARGRTLSRILIIKSRATEAKNVTTTPRTLVRDTTIKLIATLSDDLGRSITTRGLMGRLLKRYTLLPRSIRRSEVHELFEDVIDATGCYGTALNRLNNDVKEPFAKPSRERAGLLDRYLSLNTALIRMEMIQASLEDVFTGLDQTPDDRVLLELLEGTLVEGNKAIEPYNRYMGIAELAPLSLLYDGWHATLHKFPDTQQKIHLIS